MNQLEIEYKTLLTKSEYKRLKEFFSGHALFQQTNYYIDTPEFELKKNRLSLRIRTLMDRAELTLKKPLDVGNIEYNQEISLEQANQLIQKFELPNGEIKKIIQDTDIPFETLSIWGYLTTNRIEINDGLGLFALDENHYNGITDYELEIEVQNPDEGKIAFDYFLKKQSIKFKYASSKVARAAASLPSAK
ncbi:CYTH domain-containing protein [Streptococcus cameli]